MNAQELPKTLAAFFWHFLKKQPVAFSLLSLAPACIILEANVIPYAVKLVIDAVVESENDKSAIFQKITPALWLGGGAWVLMIIILRLQNWWQAYVIPRFEAQIRMGVLDYITAHSHQYFSNQMSGSLSNKVADLPRSLESIRTIVCWNGISTISVVLVSLVMMATVSPIFSWILGIWVVIHFAVTFYFAKVVDRVSEDNAEDKSRLSGSIVDTLSNIMSMKLFAGRRYELSYIGKKQQAEKDSHKKLVIVMNMLRLLMDAPVTIMLGCVVYFLITLWQQEKISTGDMIFIFNTCWAVMFHMWFLGHALTDLFRDLGVARQALAVINPPHEIIDTPNAKRLDVTKGEIEFKNVTFKYKRNNNLFEDKNVLIPSGQKIGLVGFSGSGKTTFVNLILRLFDISSGQIMIDGQDIAKVTQDSLRENISMIPQDTSLFHRTLMENIRYGKPTASDEEVIEASKRAHCHEFVLRLEKGYDSLVGERGIKLSGGQRQRIAIARAMLKNAPILILDEATSALDSVTEKHIQDGLHTLMQNHTTIVIAHRLSTLSEMDRILVFDKGTILEDGTHKQLMKDKKGHYARLWKLQAGGFLPEMEE
jgi:ATP-binding cassette subfamily B protein